AASPIASSLAISARRLPSVAGQNGSTSTKSTVPAIVVRNASVAKRLILRIPDCPELALRQLSALPIPSDVTIPIPVTATGMPALLRADVISFPLTAPARPGPCPRLANDRRSLRRPGPAFLAWATRRRSNPQVETGAHGPPPELQVQYS